MKKMLFLLLLSSPAMAGTITTYFNPIGSINISSGSVQIAKAISRVAVTCSTKAYTGGPTTMTETVPATASGDLIVVMLECDEDSAGNPYTTIPTDGAGNTYTAFGSFGNFNPSAGNHGEAAGFFYSVDAFGGVTSITAQAPSTGNMMCVFQYHSTQGWPASPTDQSGSNYNTSGGVWTSGTTASLSQARELTLGVVDQKGSASAPTFTNNTPWLTLYTSPVMNSIMANQMAENIVATTTGLSYSGTISPSGDSSTSIITFKDNP